MPERQTREEHLAEAEKRLREGGGEEVVATGQESEDDLAWLDDEELPRAQEEAPAGPDVLARVEEGAELDPDDLATLVDNLKEGGLDTAQVRSGLSEELQEALRIAEGTEGEAERFAAKTVGWSALQQVPFMADYAFGIGKRSRQQIRALESEVPQGLSEAQEQAFAAQEAGVGARSREWRMRQQSLEASKGKQVSARDLQRTRDAMRKELEEGATKIGLTKTITDITLENQQKAQIQSDLDQHAQFQSIYFNKLIATPLAETIGSVAEFKGKMDAYRAAPDVKSSIEKLREQGVPDEDIAGMLFLALEKRPVERKKYLSEIATAYTSLGDEGEARAQSAVRAAEPSPGEQAEVERTATVPAGQVGIWQLPRNGVGVHGPFELEGDETYNYYWDDGPKQYIAYAKGQHGMISIRQDNMEANNKLKPAFDQWRNTQAQQPGE